jgi:cytochrome b
MSLHVEDKKAAFVGMIVTALLIFVLCFSIVTMTNAHFEKEKAGEKAK